MKKLPKKSGKSIGWAIAFLGVLCLFFLVSFVWKLVVFLQKSSFDGNHQFNLSIRGKTAGMISFNPDQQSVAIMSFAKKPQQPIDVLLEIPSDAVVAEEPTDDIKSMLLNTAFHHTGTLSPVDSIKLWWFVQMLPKDRITAARPVDAEHVTTPTILKLFQDKSLYMEGKSITVVNAAGVSGLGNRLARLLTNIGANVIMVSTADSDVEQSPEDANR